MDKSSIFYLTSGLISMTGVYLTMNTKVLGSIHEYVPLKKIVRQFLLPVTITILGIVLMLLSLKLDKAEDISTNNQMSEIENIEKSVKNLSVFLENKKEEILITTALISKLKDEHAIFDSISKVDEQTLKNFLAIQQKANQRGNWKELGIAFVLGVITSIIGGYILERIKK